MLHLLLGARTTPSACPMLHLSTPHVVHDVLTLGTRRGAARGDRGPGRLRRAAGGSAHQDPAFTRRGDLERAHRRGGAGCIGRGIIRRWRAGAPAAVGARSWQLDMKCTGLWLNTLQPSCDDLGDMHLHSKECAANVDTAVQRLSAALFYVTVKCKIVWAMPAVATGFCCHPHKLQCVTGGRR